MQTTQSRKLLPALLAALLLLSILGPASAQDESPTIQGDLIADFTSLSEKLLSLAKAIPADKYSWRPSEGVRSVSEALMHVAGANYFFPSIVGQAIPEGVNPRAFETDYTAQEDVIRIFEQSLERMKTMLTTIDMDGEVNFFGQTMTKPGFLHTAISHNHEHLGQMIAYARSIGVVPPWSQ